MHHQFDRQIQQLAAKCLNGTITAEEQARLNEWYNRLPETPVTLPEGLDEEETKNRIFTEIIDAQKQPARILYTRVIKMAAAVLLFVVAFGVYRFADKPEVINNVVTKTRQLHDYTQKGKPEVVLKLADGSSMVLNHSGLYKHGSTTVKERGNSAYIYNNTAQSANAFNTVSTPAGMKFNIILADGTRVWLNALSSLKFPAMFGGNGREVELDGEAYFEVAKDKKHPFTVKLGNGTQVKVLGTHFNVMAYHDEDAVSATLLEGSVSVSHKGTDKIITPGQQATVNKCINVTDVDAQQAIAWKNDLFCFDSTDNREVMRQIGRWYGVKVIYNNTLNKHQLSGYASRNAKLADVLKMLELSGMKISVKQNEVEILN